MPKRSNRFQRLIRYITEQIAPIGATVEESAMVLEQGLSEPVEREVDVLLTLNAGIGTLRIGLECRDRSRKDDILWIDDLIGKYRNLSIDKVIALSSSGFTSAAQEKANLNNITTMSLTDASAAEWQNAFHTLVFLQVCHHFTLKSLIIESKPRLPSSITRGDIITVQKTADDSEPIEGPAEDFLKALYARCLPLSHEHLKANRPSVYRVLEDLANNVLVEHCVPITGTVLTREDGSKYDISVIGFKFVVKTNVTNLPTTRQLFAEQAMLTSTTFVDTELAEKFTITAVEVKGKSEGKGFVERTTIAE